MSITLEAGVTRQRGDFRRRGVDGPPMVSAPDGATVKSGKREGAPKLVTYGRPSNFGARIEDAWNLLKWKERELGWALASTPSTSLDEVAVARDALLEIPRDRDDSRWRAAADELVAAAYRQARSMEAAERGTHTHQTTEDDDLERDWVARAERGEALGIPATAQEAMVAAWRAMLQGTGMEVLAVELPVVCDRWRLAGTLDRIARLTEPIQAVNCDGEVISIAAGTVVVLDIKTGKMRRDNNGVISRWHKYAVQIAAYAHSLPYDVDADARLTWTADLPQPSTTVAVIAHLPVADALAGRAVCRLVAVDLRAGEHAAELCLAAKRWEERRDVFASCVDEYAVDVFPGEDTPGPPVDTFAGLPTSGDTPPSAARHAAIEARLPQRITPVASTPDDDLNGGEGPNATDAQWQAIVARLKTLRTASPAAFAALEAIVKAAAEESPATHGISRKVPSRRRWLIYRGLLALAEHFADELADEHLRCVGVVIADAQQLAMPIHRALLALTCAEAERFHRAAVDVVAGDLALTFDGDSPRWVAITTLAANPAA